MHILLLNDDALPEGRGGVAVLVDTLRRGLAESGHRVTLLTTHQTRERPLEERREDTAGLTISMYVHSSPQERHRRCVTVTPVSAVCERLLATLRPDVVHAHNLHAFLTYDLLRVARLHTPRVFLTAHDTFLVSFGRVVLQGFPFRLRLFDHLRSAGRTYSPLRNVRIRKILRSSVRTLIVYSHAMERFLSDHGIGNTVYIPNGIPVLPPPPSERIAAFRTTWQLTGPTILFGGRISGDKGVDALLRALEQVHVQLPSCICLVVGEEARLRPHLHDLPGAVRKNIRSTGWLSPEEMVLAYAAADVVTVPSLYLDNFPTINLEAMAAGKPVVGTCFGGTPELVLDGVTGFIVNPRETEQFAGALLRILQNPEEAQRMGTAGKRRVQEHFSLRSQLDATLQLYHSFP